MVPPMRADEVLGSEVRTSDDKIVGEVRNIVIGTGGGPDYAIVASGGFFVPGKKSLVVALDNFRVSQERNSFYLSVTRADLPKIPLMPDNKYHWVTDQAWLARNNASFSGEPK